MLRSIILTNMPDIYVQSCKIYRRRQVVRKELVLSVYGFMCGYQMRKSSSVDTWKTIYMEHRHFHVVYMYEGNRIIWNTYDFEDYGLALKLYLNIIV